jgi:polyisoprenyl-phosphate glycosyltransferase
MPFVSVVTGCYNEEENVRELYDRVCRVFKEQLPDFSFELVIIDNASEDRTVEILKGIAGSDHRVKVIVNNRNFGALRSGYHAMLQARGDAVVAMASDLEDPPELIPQFLRKWQEGYQIVLAQKRSSEDLALFRFLRKLYYHVVTRLSETPLVKDATGFGVYDRQVIEDIRKIGDPYPYFRGLICELGYSRYLIPFDKPTRKRGITKNNFYTLYDLAMLGITNHSKVPLRLATFAGFCTAILSFLIALGYLVYKLLFWTQFQVGMAPVVMGIFFIGSVQLFFIGILGEYIGSIYTQVLKRPPVIERERINFDTLSSQSEPGATTTSSALEQPALSDHAHG